MCEELEEVLVVGREESAATPPSMNVDPPSLRSRVPLLPGLRWIQVLTPL